MDDIKNVKQNSIPRCQQLWAQRGLQACILFGSSGNVLKNYKGIQNLSTLLNIKKIHCMFISDTCVHAYLRLIPFYLFSVHVQALLQASSSCINSNHCPKSSLVLTRGSCNTLMQITI